MTDTVKIERKSGTTPESVASTYPFPTETIDLPSRGLVYPKSNPLSSGRLDIKYMSAKEEDILSNPNFLKKGVVISKLLESVVVTPGVDLNDIILGDENAILYAVRLLGLGPKYGIRHSECKHCNETDIPFNIDLTKIKEKEIKYDDLNTNNEYEFTIPRTGTKLTFRFITHGDDEDIAIQRRNMERLSKESQGAVSSGDLTTRLYHMILSVDGDRNAKSIRDFVDNKFISIDIRDFRKHLKEVTPGLETTYLFKCPECGGEEVLNIPMGVGFLWPSE